MPERARVQSQAYGRWESLCRLNVGEKEEKKQEERDVKKEDGRDFCITVVGANCGEAFPPKTTTTTLQSSQGWDSGRAMGMSANFLAPGS